MPYQSICWKVALVFFTVATYGCVSSELNAQATNTFPTSGNVGIGTTSPTATLDVEGRIGLDDGYDHTDLSQNAWGGSHTLAFGAYQGASVPGPSDSTGWFQNSQNAGAYAYGPALMEYVANGGAWNFFIGPASTGVGQNVVWGTSVLTLQRGGYVGIGTNNPSSTLEVDGNVKLTQGSGASLTFADGTVQSTAYTGTCSATGGDYAESVDVIGAKSIYEPGDLMEIDKSSPTAFRRSNEPYSKRVAGVYSTKPGYVGRRQKTSPSQMGEEIPMAMIGIVPAKVTAENGAIEPGDLLVSSSTEGFAMKGTDADKMMGSVIGKAMGSLDSGKGMIEVLVTLQ